MYRWSASTAAKDLLPTNVSITYVAGCPIKFNDKKIDPIEVEKLAAMHCSTAEIAAFFECSSDTIERRFAAILIKGKEKGKSKLRRLQWQSAEKGNVVMLIWLGKQYLGQTDKQEMSASTPIPITIAKDEQDL